MKIVCILIYDNSNLTIYKQYETVADHMTHDLSLTHYRMYDDLGKMVFYRKYLFISLEEFRNRQLDKIL